MFFTLNTPVSFVEPKEQTSSNFCDEIRTKFEKLKLDLSCKANVSIQQPAKIERKDCILDLEELESLGSSALSQQEAPTTPRIKQLNEDGEYE